MTTKQLLLREPHELTLREAWQRYYRDPAALCRQSLQSVECTLSHWERCTGDPPIGEITNLVTQPFRLRYLQWPNPHKTRLLWLAALRGEATARQLFSLLELDVAELAELADDERLARVTAHIELLGESTDPLLSLLRPKATTYNRVQRELQAIFNRLGPSTYGNPDGLGILPQAPRLLTMDEPEPEPIVAEPEQISAMFQACEACTWPALSETGIPPALLWRVLIVVVFNTALRRGDLLSIECRRINRAARTMQVRQGKTEKFRTYFLNDTLLHWLTKIENPPRERLFPFNSNESYFYREWHTLQRRAGIVVERPAGSDRVPVFGLHELRKTSLSAHFEEDPTGASAQAMGAHESLLTTMRHYISAKAKQGVMRRAAENLPQPTAFLPGGASPPPHRPGGSPLPRGWGLVG